MPVRTFRDAKGRKRFAVEFESRGHRVFRRLPSGATKEQAQQLETRLKHELIDQAVLGKKPNVSLKFAIESWLEEAVKGRKSEAATDNHASHVIALTERLGGCDVAGCGVVADAIRGVATPGAGTINRRLCVLKAVCKFAWRKGWTEENLSGKIQLLPEPQYQRREVTQEMAEKLIENAPNARAKALIAFSAYTGLRLGEVRKLKPEDVQGGVIWVKDAKTGKDRVVPILPQLKPHLGELPFNAGWRNVYRGFESARRRSGIQIRYHDLRHMVASALARSDADLRLSMDIMGHRSIETHRRYVHTDIKARKRALSRALPVSIPIRKRTKAKKAA